MMFSVVIFCAAAALFADGALMRPRGNQTRQIRDKEYEFKRLAMQNPDLYDGDMAGIEGPNDVERNVIPGYYYRWPNARVPYVIDQSLHGLDNMFNAAFNNYHQHTCVRFVPRTTEYDYVYMFAGQGCYSMVGRVGGQQALSLGDGCLYVGTTIHELGHAIGFYHEQNRSDRDDYLYIYLNNVVYGMESNFAKLYPNQNILFTNFDYNSIMIYGNNAFSSNGYWTMEATNGQALYEPFEKNSMTWSDIERVNRMYEC
ncbi:zinc metalloproteinase nas-8 [Caerostris darwini]|uniref:Metalloendopeptidase n=1 Tax=Caerostris darwini TaxID=1538125 RepID=A0AAV4QR08_9ARAC|nr:zinc metalloproteinase nas-8 [Caerostris darwini]